MSFYNPPPIQTPIINKEKEAFGLLAPEWTQYMNQTFTGDTGTSWVPIATNLGSTGTPTLTGLYFKDGQFIDFEIHIIPATDTTATSGSTYITLPFTVLSDGGCFTKIGTAAGGGAVDAATSRVYTPTWATTNLPVTLAGRVRAR